MYVSRAGKRAAAGKTPRERSAKGVSKWSLTAIYRTLYFGKVELMYSPVSDEFPAQSGQVFGDADGHPVPLRFPRAWPESRGGRSLCRCTHRPRKRSGWESGFLWRTQAGSSSGKRFVKGKLHLMSHGYLNFVLMSVLPSLWHNKVSYAIINYLEDKFIVTGGEGCRVGKLSGAKSIPPRSFSKRTFKNLFWICCGCRQDLCYAGGRSPGSKQRDRRCCGLH